MAGKKYCITRIRPKTPSETWVSGEYRQLDSFQLKLRPSLLKVGKDRGQWAGRTFVTYVDFPAKKMDG
jgi:hypothetical protein